MESGNSLFDRLHFALREVFPNPPTFFVDDSCLSAWLENQGFLVERFDPKNLELASEAARENAVLVSTSDSDVNYNHLDKAFHDSRLLILPLFAFDPSLEAAKYTLEMLARSDFGVATRRNQELVSSFSKRNEPIRFLGHGTDLSIALGDKIHLMQPKEDPMLMPGEWEAVAAWLETAFIPSDDNIFEPGYKADGVFVAQGVAVAYHRHAPPAVAKQHDDAWKMLRKLQVAGEFPLTLTIENSHLKTAITPSGQDVAPGILELTNPKLELLVVEVAMSGNSGIQASEIDWSINSVANEGSAGVHIACGDGETGAHIDFIAPGVEVI